jgi:hypothetical protein
MSLGLFCLGLLSPSGNALATGCDKSSADPTAAQSVTVGIYTEWTGTTEAQAKFFEQIIEDHLSAETFFVCTVDKALFPPLGTAKLFDVNSVRVMIKDPSKLGSDPASFEQKVRDYNIKYLLFVRTEFAGNSGTSRFNAVRVDPSGVYAPDGFAADFAIFDSFDDSKSAALRAKMTSALNKLAKAGSARPYPIMVTCFNDGTAGAEPTWPMDQLTEYIPKQMAQKLMQDQNKPYFKKSYPLYFQGRCPFPGLDAQLAKELSSKWGEEHWFVWTGRIYFQGPDLQVEVDFLHYVDNIPVQYYMPWAPRRKISPWEIHEKAAPTIASKWEEYLKNDVSARRPGVPLP